MQRHCPFLALLLRPPAATGHLLLRSLVRASGPAALRRMAGTVVAARRHAPLPVTDSCIKLLACCCQSLTPFCACGAAAADPDQGRSFATASHVDRSVPSDPPNTCRPWLMPIWRGTTEMAQALLTLPARPLFGPTAVHKAVPTPVPAGDRTPTKLVALQRVQVPAPSKAHHFKDPTRPASSASSAFAASCASSPSCASSLSSASSASPGCASAPPAPPAPPAHLLPPPLLPPPSSPSYDRTARLGSARGRVRCPSTRSQTIVHAENIDYPQA